MEEKELKDYAEAYAEKYEPRFRKVAGIAYLDGMEDALKWVRENLEEV